jgi:hypothetical protein
LLVDNPNVGVEVFVDDEKVIGPVYLGDVPVLLQFPKPYFEPGVDRPRSVRIRAGTGCDNVGATQVTDASVNVIAVR